MPEVARAYTGSSGPNEHETISNVTPQGEQGVLAHQAAVSGARDGVRAAVMGGFSITLSLFFETDHVFEYSDIGFYCFYFDFLVMVVTGSCLQSELILHKMSSNLFTSMENDEAVVASETNSLGQFCLYTKMLTSQNSFCFQRYNMLTCEGGQNSQYRFKFEMKLSPNLATPTINI